MEGEGMEDKNEGEGMEGGRWAVIEMTRWECVKTESRRPVN